MIYQLAQDVIERLYRRANLEESKKPVYVYGMELLISTMCSVISILLISLFLPHPLSGILFLAIFISLRLFSGGYHASTYSRCFVLTNIVFLLTHLVSSCLAANINSFICIAFSCLSSVFIFILSPIKNKKHPLSVVRYARNKKIARALILVWCGISILLSIWQTGYYAIQMSVILIAIAIMMIIPKLKEGRV